ncbi:MAG: hypothetical protein ACREMG_04865 [Gemmatimonadales bacterium]
MSMITRGWAALLMAVSACSSGGALPVQPGTSGVDKTGLEGTARLGPIQPVCREGEPCDAPLEAGFTLQQDGHNVVRFASDSIGHFLVYTAAGIYVVVPDEPIGIGSQTLEVIVGAEGLTHVDLMFDTGIR